MIVPVLLTQLTDFCHYYNQNLINSNRDVVYKCHYMWESKFYIKIYTCLEYPFDTVEIYPWIMYATLTYSLSTSLVLR